MNECDQTMVDGDCGWECPVFLRGECSIANELADGASPENRELYWEIYDA